MLCVFFGNTLIVADFLLWFRKLPVLFFFPAHLVSRLFTCNFLATDLKLPPASLSVGTTWQGTCTILPRKTHSQTHLNFFRFFPVFPRRSSFNLLRIQCNTVLYHSTIVYRTIPNPWDIIFNLVSMYSGQQTSSNFGMATIIPTRGLKVFDILWFLPSSTSSWWSAISKNGPLKAQVT